MQKTHRPLALGVNQTYAMEASFWLSSQEKLQSGYEKH